MPQKCVLEINLSLGRSAEEELHFSWAMASIFQTCGIQMPVWTEHSPSWGRHTHTPHKNRFTSQNKPGLECRSFPVDAAEHEVLPRCAGAIKCSLAGTRTSWFRGTSLCVPCGAPPGVMGALPAGSSSFPLIPPPRAILGPAHPAPRDGNTPHTPQIVTEYKESGNFDWDPFVNSPLNELKGQNCPSFGHTQSWQINSLGNRNCSSFPLHHVWQ